VPGGYDVTGAGNGIGGVSDQFQYSYRQVSGDFDFQTRIDGLPVTDAFLRAGLMARESLGSNSRFAAAFASSVQLGCFFESRTSPGAASTQASPAGGFPPNYPQAWLRLQRQGSTLSGYGSFDGQTWYLLGSVTFGNLPQTLYYGLAVSSDNPATATTARFRNLGSTTSPAGSLWVPQAGAPGSS
jgi:hypothetical protein